MAELAKHDPGDAHRAGLSEAHPIWRFFGADNPTLKEYLELDDVVVMAAFEPMSRADDPIVAEFAGRLRDRRLYKTLDLRSFGEDKGLQNRRARQIDQAVKEGNFVGAVHKDEGAKIGIYTQIGGDDERTHKKLHILDGAGAPQEITGFSDLILALANPRQFTRYYFENDSDRQSAKRLRRA